MVRIFDRNISVKTTKNFTYLIFNVIRHGICGYFQIDSDVFEDHSPMWIDGVYPLRVKLKPLKIHVSIPFKEINGQLINKETQEPIVGNSLLGASMVPLKTEEAESLINKINGKTLIDQR